MGSKDSKNLLDNAVPHPEAARGLSEGEKKALELQENAEHSHGGAREKLQKEATESAEQDHEP